MQTVHQTRGTKWLYTYVYTYVDHSMDCLINQTWFFDDLRDNQFTLAEVNLRLCYVPGVLVRCVCTCCGAECTFYCILTAPQRCWPITADCIRVNAIKYVFCRLQAFSSNKVLLADCKRSVPKARSVPLISWQIAVHKDWVRTHHL